ncbi:putative WRKY transcription factor 27 [Drosera capensis]
MMDDDHEEWDLYAVVRNVTTATKPSSTAAAAATNNATIDSILTSMLIPTVIEDQLVDFGALDRDNNWDSMQLTRAANPFDELGKLYRPFIPSQEMPRQQQQPEMAPAAASAMTGTFDVYKRSILQQQQMQQQAILIQQQQQHQQILLFQRQQQQYFAQQRQLQHQLQPPPPPQQYRCRKRKNDQKRTTCQVTAENILMTDKWAWRKYGQKPIKGSPYPRNYYRCSSSKGCTARKQVERSPTDPNIYVVTYTGDHCHPRPTHRNSLAGSTRTKFRVTNNDDDQLPATATFDRNNNPTDSSPTGVSSAAPPAAAASSSSSPGSSSSLAPTKLVVGPGPTEEKGHVIEDDPWGFDDDLEKLVGGDADDEMCHGFDELLDGELFFSMEEMGDGVGGGE